MIKKVGLFLGPAPSDGGAVQYAQAMLSAVAALPKHRYAAVAACTREQWSMSVKAQGIPDIRVPYGFLGRLAERLYMGLHMPLAIWRSMSPTIHPVAKALVRESCDLWIFPSQERWSYEVPVRNLSTIHDLMHRYERRYPEVTAGGEYLRRERHYQRVCSWSAGIVVDSELGKKQVVDSYDIAPDKVYPLPFIAPPHMFVEQQPADFDLRYRLPAKYIFYPAHFWEHKNHLRLVQAVKLLKPQLPDIRLVFAGSTKNGSIPLEEYIKRSGMAGDVTILGYVPDRDMPELYRRARALVMPTFFGPTNIPPLEAFAAGCPVAISRIYAMPEQLGDAAVYFDPSSVDDISRVLRDLWTDDSLCRDLTVKGRDHAAAWGQKEFNERFRQIVEAVLAH